MQASSDDLFDLIKSLSRSEKRYFSVEKEGSTQLLLFNILNALDEYDEEKVKAQLYKRLGNGEKTDKYLRRLTIEKYNLYQAILKVMRNFRSEKSDYIKLKETLIDAKHLLDKGLYSQSGKLLRKAKKLAKEYDNQLALLEINRAERSFVWMLKERNRGQEIEELIVEKDKALQLLKTELSHQDYYDKMCLELARHHRLTQIKIEEFKKKFQEFLFNENDKGLTAFAHLRHIQTKGFFHILMQEQALVSETLNEEFHWWEQNPKYKKEDFFRYKISLNNYLLANYRSKKYSAVLGTLEALEKKQSKSSFEELLVFDFISTFKLLIYLNTTQLEKAKRMLPFIEKGLRNYFLSFSKRMTITHNVGLLFFFTEDFNNSTKWLLKLLKRHNTGKREDIRTFASLLLSICYFELDEIDKMENLFRSIQRSIKGNGQIDSQDLESSILIHLKQISHTPLLEQKAALTDFKNDLQAIKGDAHQKKMIPFLDEFYIWAKSRSDRRPIWEVLKEENEKPTEEE